MKKVITALLCVSMLALAPACVLNRNKKEQDKKHKEHGKQNKYTKKDSSTKKTKKPSSTKKMKKNESMMMDMDEE